MEKYPQHMLTCGPYHIMENSSLPTQSVVSVFLSDSPVELADGPVVLYFLYFELGIRVLGIGANLLIQMTCLAPEKIRNSGLHLSRDTCSCYQPLVDHRLTCLI